MYCYTDGKETIARFYRAGSQPKTFRKNGRRWTRDFTAESVGVPSSAGWPMTCMASGVNPEQAGELRKFYVEHGVPTEVTKDGNPVYRSAEHRRRALKARKMHDNSSYF